MRDVFLFRVGNDKDKKKRVIHLPSARKKMAVRGYYRGDRYSERRHDNGDMPAA